MLQEPTSHCEIVGYTRKGQWQTGSKVNQFELWAERYTPSLNTTLRRGHNGAITVLSQENNGKPSFGIFWS